MNTTPHFRQNVPKFVHYHPRTAILNNLEFDHADIFPIYRLSKPSSTIWYAPYRGRG